MKTYIWTLPTRIFHWVLVVYIALMFITSEFDSWIYYHVAFGYGIGVLILFRIIWGFIGPRYSRFSDWSISINKAREFMLNITKQKDYYAGHNPAASLLLLGVILVIVLTLMSGVLSYGEQEGKGVFAWLNGTSLKEMELFEGIHEAFSTLILILIGAHIAGVGVDYLLHKKNGTLISIFKGHKNIKAQTAILTPFQKIVATIFLSVALILPPFVIFFNAPSANSKHTVIDYQN